MRQIQLWHCGTHGHRLPFDVRNAKIRNFNIEFCAPKQIERIHSQTSTKYACIYVSGNFSFVCACVRCDMELLVLTGYVLFVVRHRTWYAHIPRYYLHCRHTSSELTWGAKEAAGFWRPHVRGFHNKTRFNGHQRSPLRALRWGMGSPIPFGGARSPQRLAKPESGAAIVRQT